MTITTSEPNKIIIDALELVNPFYMIPTCNGKEIKLSLSSIYNRTVKLGNLDEIKLDYLLDICHMIKEDFDEQKTLPSEKKIKLDNSYLISAFQGNAIQENHQDKPINMLNLVDRLDCPEKMVNLRLDYKKGKIPKCHIKREYSPWTTNLLYTKFHNSINELKKDLRDIQKELELSERFRIESDVSGYWKEKEPILSKVYNQKRIYNNLADEHYLRCWANRYRERLFKHIFIVEFEKRS
ncbi:hypothetical protein HN385_00865 [archaeon]|jgi:hypothetical protein|nr:hypothetical protein [archaeon]MBT3451222.1 hypothetical protein [archaeon]MBT6868673.1 hypothetical protein [archaeon]MBT7193461.1 hypothetical protein [archaeon]MBT7381052.1 hypothetical protein [archaeon]